MLPHYEEFLADREQYCSAKTLQYYIDCLNKFSKFTTELRADVYGEYVRYLRKQNLKNTSIRTYARGVKVYFNWLKEMQYINIRLIGQSKLPRPDSSIIQVLTQSEVERLDGVISGQNRLIIHLMLDCGLRAGEVRGLTWREIDLEKGLLRVQKTKSLMPHIVPLPPRMIEELAKYKAAVNAHAPFDISENALKLRFRKIKKKSGLQQLHAHLLRHTFGTSFITYRMGDLERLRLLLGHQDIATTCRYIHLAQIYDLEQIEVYKIDEVFRR